MFVTSPADATSPSGECSGGDWQLLITPGYVNFVQLTSRVSLWQEFAPKRDIPTSRTALLHAVMHFMGKWLLLGWHGLINAAVRLFHIRKMHLGSTIIG